MRERLNEALKDALKGKDQCTASTLRLVLAALKDRDIAARGDGNQAGIGEDEIIKLLQSMIKQRKEAIALYEQGGRLELAEREQQEIGVIERFLPPQLNEAAVQAAVQQVISELGATGVKDLGRVMGTLRERYAGCMDFAKAGATCREILS